ncbi:MAG: hypothetical protein BACD_00095 [Bacteroides rodentium]
MYISENTSQIGETSIEKIKQIEEPTYKIRAKVVEPTITEVDWSGYFEEINGTGVIRSYIEEYEKNLTVCFNLKDPTFNMFLVD